MNVQKTRLVASCIGGLLVLSASMAGISEAHACDAHCQPIAISLEDAVVPANATGAAVRGEYGMTDMMDERYSLHNLDTGEWGVADAYFRGSFGAEIVFFYPLQPNTSYGVGAPDPCTGEVVGIEFSTVEEAPFPSTLGALEVSPRQLGEIQVSEPSSCEMTAQAAYVDITLDLDEEAIPWDQALVYETYVDGEPWRPLASQGQRIIPGHTWIGRGEDRIFTLCDDVDDSVYQAEEGLRTVEIVARHPGRTDELATESVTIDLHCGPIVESESDEPGSSDSGGCSTANTGAVPSAILALLVPLLIFGRRRRVRTALS